MQIDLNQLYTAKEASRKLGKTDSYIKNIVALYPNRLLPGSYRKIGREIILTKEGIDHLKKQLKD